MILWDVQTSGMHGTQVSATLGRRICKYRTKILENVFLESMNSGLFKNEYTQLFRGSLGYIFIYLYYMSTCTIFRMLLCYLLTWNTVKIGQACIPTQFLSYTNRAGIISQNE